MPGQGYLIFLRHNSKLIYSVVFPWVESRHLQLVYVIISGYGYFVLWFCYVCIFGGRDILVGEMECPEADAGSAYGCQVDFHHLSFW